MAPKKKEQQKMSLGTFLQDEKLGSWADEMEDMPIYSRTGFGGGERRTYSSTTGTYGNATGGYSVREELPLPDKPPYTVHLGNLSFNATAGDVEDFFAGCSCTNVRIIEDKLEMKPKGFAYVEFENLEGLKQALTLTGSQFQGRNVRISVADPPKDRDRPDAREFGDWSRKGPLPDLPSRGGNDRRPSDRGFGSNRAYGDAGSDIGGGERREKFPQDDGKLRDFGNWERKGPLSPLPQAERPSASRDGGRPRADEGPRAESFRDRKPSPAAWGEGRPQGSQDGSRPPRREFQERPAVERTPTAAEQDSQWRTKMKPDAPPAKSPVPSREGSEAPSSPAVAPAPLSRPKLNLAKRTVSEAPDAASPTTSVSGDAKASPFGAARPIDTAAKERELEEKRQNALREKKEADEKAREEKRVAKEAAAAAAAEKAEKTTTEDETAAAPTEILQRGEGGAPADDDASAEVAPKEGQNGDAAAAAPASAADDKTAKPKEPLRDAKPRPSESAWRKPMAGGPRHAKDAPRGPRGDGAYRAPRSDGPRNPRANGAPNAANAAPAAAPAAPAAAEADAVAPEEDGWSTVSKPKKNQRGGNQGSRAIPS